MIKEIVQVTFAIMRTRKGWTSLVNWLILVVAIIILIALIIRFKSGYTQGEDSLIGYSKGLFGTTND